MRQVGVAASALLVATTTIAATAGCTGTDTRSQAREIAVGLVWQAARDALDAVVAESTHPPPEYVASPTDYVGGLVGAAPHNGHVMASDDHPDGSFWVDVAFTRLGEAGRSSREG